ncbi:hypothetical protein E8E13_005566 [Curvularia kusanoi]|uniref:Uncharacterized protein n=1 Tax=Curvularia kusanoi TaxID=90978 RepID=A0A9P4W614_CURKU|nr:hypothetical protein E8E13_005566 [Curvularia kusanoi]
MSGIFDDYVESHPEDVLPPDAISYLLGKIINFSFAKFAQQLSRDRQEQWQSLKSALESWKARLPASYAPFSHSGLHGNPFPSLWMLQPCHIAAQQYLAIAEMLLILNNPRLERESLSQHMSELVQDQALRICGMAWTTADEAAWVNSFGPMAFCELAQT